MAGIMSYFSSIQLRGIADNTGLQDAFGSLRVSEKFTIFDSKQIFNDGDRADNIENTPQFFDNQETSGSGTATLYDPDRASTTLSVSATTAGTRVRQSKRRINYQPGKSQLAFLTGIIAAGGSGITCRYGLFDEQNGLFFECADGVLGVVRRTYVSGSAIDNRIAQSSWNIDKMDGTGKSGITIDPDLTQIFVIDFEWLGVGRVRFGFVIDGILYYCHELLNTNVLNAVYMSTPNLPVRAEINNDGTGAAESFEMICASVISEGGIEETGISRTHNTGTTLITIGSTANTYPIIGVRLRSTHLGLQLDVQSLGLLLTSSPDSILWTLQINPTLSGALSFSNLNLSGTQVATTAATATVTVTTPGEIIDSGFIASTNQNRDINVSTLNVNEKLGSLIDGTPDELWLCAQPLGSSTDMRARISWTEGL